MITAKACKYRCLFHHHNNKECTSAPSVEEFSYRRMTCVGRHIARNALWAILRHAPTWFAWKRSRDDDGVERQAAHEKFEILLLLFDVENGSFAEFSQRTENDIMRYGERLPCCILSRLGFLSGRELSTEDSSYLFYCEYDLHGFWFMTFYEWCWNHAEYKWTQIWMEFGNIVITHFGEFYQKTGTMERCLKTVWLFLMTVAIGVETDQTDASLEGRVMKRSIEGK